MKQGTFSHNVDPLELMSVASQTGTHTLIVYANGATKTEEFEATSGDAFQIPNLFPEFGTYKFKIIQPDATEFDDGSNCCLASPGCLMSLDILFSSCVSA